MDEIVENFNKEIMRELKFAALDRRQAVRCEHYKNAKELIEEMCEYCMLLGMECKVKSLAFSGAKDIIEEQRRCINELRK